MVFWGVEVKGGQVHKLIPPANLHLSTASLGIDAKDDGKRNVLTVTVDNVTVALATLITGKSDTTPLDVIFAEGSDVQFKVSGTSSISLSGYYVPEDQFDDESDDEEDSDEEAFHTHILPPKSNVRLEEIGDDDDDEDDETPPKLVAGPGGLGEDDDDDEDDEDDDEGDEDDDEDDEEDDDEEDEEIKPVAKPGEKRPGPGQPDASKKAKVNAPQGKQPQQQGKPVTPAKPTTPAKAAANGQTPKQGQPQQQQQQQKKDKNKQTPQQQQQGGKPGPSPQQQGKPQNQNQNKQQQTPKQPQQKPGPQSTPAQSGKKDQNQKPGGQKQKLPSGLEFEDLKTGSGKKPTPGKHVLVHYTGRLPTGKIFDSSLGKKPFKFRLGVQEVIKGWDQGVAGMQVGGKRKLIIPPALGYGSRGAPPDIPPNSTLHFDVELIEAK